jgi:LacI family transcriptional regulator
VKVTSFVVAEAAKVSQSTVSRALRGDPNIAAETVRRVVAVATELGYVPSERARDLSTRTTRRIAMLVDLDNPLWSLLVSRLHDELADRGYRLTLIAGHGDQQTIETNLLGGGVDGVIVCTVTLQSTLPALLHQRGVPAVLLHRYAEDGSEPAERSGDSGAGGTLDACVADNRAGGAAAAQLLLDAGHRRIAALFGPRDTSTGRDRAAGFLDRLADAGATPGEDRLRYGSFDFAYGRASLPELMTQPDPPTAIFCSNDEIALGALNAACERQLRVPDDVAVVGFDDLDQAAWPLIGLTTISVPFADMLHSAVNLLLERIGGYAGGGRRLIHPVKPVLRRTHGGRG